MSRIARLEPIGGAAGDMILGAFLDAGLDFLALQERLSCLPWHGYTLRAERVNKAGVWATQLHVDLPEHKHHHGEIVEGGVPLAEIDAGLQASTLPRSVISLARTIFGALTWAEAGIHSVTWQDVRFDAVDVLDSIVDIVGAAIALDLLEIEKVYCGPLPAGRGSIMTHHGPLDLPFPTVMEILSRASVPLRNSTNGEQVTPTGAAILATVADFTPSSVEVEKTGFGAGSADLPVPNVLKLELGTCD